MEDRADGLQPALRAAINRLILRRLRVALVYGLAATAAFTAANHLTWAQPPAWTDAMNLFMAVSIALALAATRMAIVERHSVAVALVLCSGGCVLRALAGIWHGDVAPTALALSGLTLITAATLPWGVWAQATMAVIAGAAMAANSYLVLGNLGPPPGHATATVGLGLAVSIALAVELQRHRLALITDNLARQQAEQRLAELNLELERRVAERTAALDAASEGLRRESQERLQALHELRESEKRLQDILDNAPAAIQLKDSAGRYLLVNRYWEAAFDTRREAVIGKTPYDLFPPAIADSLHANDRAVMTTGQPLRCEEILEHGGADHVYLSVKFPLVDSEGGVVGVCGISTEITDRKVTEAELRRSEAALSALIDNTEDAIWSVDRAERIMTMNAVARARFREHFGVELDPVTRDAVPPPLQEEFRDLYRRALAGEHVHVERAYDGPRGIEHYLTAVHPIVEGGAVTGATVFSKDVTQRKRAEEQTRAHQAELAHVLRLGTMGEMAAGLAHEINQPLGVIANYAQGSARRLREGSIGSAELLPIVDAIAHESLRAGAVIRRLRDMLRKEPPERRAVDLNELVREAALFVDGDARRHCVAVHLDLAADLPPLLGDGVQIEQVLLNLLRNAIEAVEASANGDRHVNVSTVARSDGAEVLVEDSGIGLPAEPDMVFKPFYSTKADGLGMGLAISRSIIEAHGGELCAAANPGRGSTFRFILPASTDDTGPDSHEESSPSPHA